MLIISLLKWIGKNKQRVDTIAYKLPYFLCEVNCLISAVYLKFLLLYFGYCSPIDMHHFQFKRFYRAAESESRYSKYSKMTKSSNLGE